MVNVVRQNYILQELELKASTCDFDSSIMTRLKTLQTLITPTHPDGNIAYRIGDIDLIQMPNLTRLALRNNGIFTRYGLCRLHLQHAVDKLDLPHLRSLTLNRCTVGRDTFPPLETLALDYHTRST